jgi:hypothetical protein
VKQDIFVEHNKANDERTPSGHGNAVMHPIQKKIDKSPRQRAQQNHLTQLQEASAPAKSNGLPLPLRTGIEALSGMDMSNVAVHRNSDKPAQLNALAYAQGNDIHLGPGQERHLPHEAWHVVQQAQGRVPATMQARDGTPVNDDRALESEADVMGSKALQRKHAAQQSPLFDAAAHAYRPIAQRLEVDGEEITVNGSLEPSIARTYLERLSTKDEKIKVRDNDEYLDLATRGVADSEEVNKYQDALTLITLAGERVPKIAALGHKEAVIKKIIDMALEESNAIKPPGWQIHASTRDWGGMAKVVLKSFNVKTGVLAKANGQIRRLGLDVGLPGFHADTLNDFEAVERMKSGARITRAPIDAIFQKYSLELEAKIPGAKLAYRGSLARGVKSPSKYVPGHSGPGLAPFDAAAVKSTPSTLWPSAGDPSFDVDGNVELPKEVVKDDIREGPISNSNASNEIIKFLLGLQKKMDKEIKEAGVKGYDTSEPFSFFISSPRKSGRQLEQGTPYPADMLKNAGLTGFARSLPSFWSGELVRKVQEYARLRTIWKTDEIWYLPPLNDWDPYFARLYTTIRNSGPRAVAMPDVQVVFEKGIMSEVTDTAEPRDDADFKGPVDLLTSRDGFAFVKLGGTPKKGDLYAGEVSNIIPSKKKEGSSTVFIKSDRVSFASFPRNADSYANGMHVLCEVDRLSEDPKQKHVVKILKVIQ